VNSIQEERLRAVLNGIERAAAAAGRNAAEITLVGVSKFHPAEAVVEMAMAGLRDFGENRVQEAAGKKVEVVGRLGDLGVDAGMLRWHLVGHLQSNKAAKAAEIFDVIQTVDSVELVKRLGDAAGGLGKRVDCLVQVNTSGETTKSGVELHQGIFLAEAIVAEPALRFKGLMTIGPLTDDMGLVREAFQLLRDLRDEMQRNQPAWGRLELSMGMTDDYPLAIACGATMIRIGTALFGSRRLNNQEGA